MKLRAKKDEFFYLVILTFVFVSTTAMALGGRLQVLIPKLPILAEPQKSFPPIPLLTVNSSYPVLSAQGVLAVDLNSGVNLYEKNPDTPLLPASTTKIVTALVSLDTYKLDQVLTIPQGVAVDGQKMGLFPGEQMKFEDVLYGLLVYSANDAAEALARDYPATSEGALGYDAFIAAMNKKAADLSMKNTQFANPVGLDQDGQITTAKDLVRAAEVAMRNPEFAKIVGTKEINITDATGKYNYDLKNINELLGSVPGVMGVKTGWTENARENLVTYIVRDNHKVMIALLGSQDRFGETKELINWIFASYKWQPVVPN